MIHDSLKKYCLAKSKALLGKFDRPDLSPA